MRRISHRIIATLCMTTLASSQACSIAQNRSGNSLEPRDTNRIAFLLDGQPVRFEHITPSMSELSGGRVLEEAALGLLLERRIDELGILISGSQIDQERSLLAEQFNADASSGQLLEQIRRNRGLGPTRYDQLLRRNAALRAVVRDDPNYSSRIEQRRQDATSIMESDSATIRLAVFRSSQDAAQARASLNALEAPALQWAFAETCLRESTHASAPSGGLLRDLRLRDPRTPHGVAQAARTLEPGEISRVLETALGPSLVYLIERRARVEITDQERIRIETRARVATEQLMMEQLARELLDNASIIVTDPSLEWSYTR